MRKRPPRGPGMEIERYELIRMCKVLGKTDAAIRLVQTLHAGKEGPSRVPAVGRGRTTRSPATHGQATDRNSIRKRFWRTHFRGNRHLSWEHDKRGRSGLDEVYSIELAEEFYERAKRRFSGRDHITILQGDSGEVLGSILNKIETPCLFWLDGHYSGGDTAKGTTSTPIQRELDHIVEHPAWRNHVILIDDARLFTGQDDYPTLLALEDWARSTGYMVFEVKDDIVRIHNDLPARRETT